MLEISSLVLHRPHTMMGSQHQSTFAPEQERDTGRGRWEGKKKKKRDGSKFFFTRLVTQHIFSFSDRNLRVTRASVLRKREREGGREHARARATRVQPRTCDTKHGYIEDDSWWVAARLMCSSSSMKIL